METKPDRRCKWDLNLDDIVHFVSLDQAFAVEQKKPAFTSGI
jgi:hypothetical protein